MTPEIKALTSQYSAAVGNGHLSAARRLDRIIKSLEKQMPEQKTRHYSVVWAPKDNDTEDHLARVQIIEGYSTFVDIPKIIGITRDLSADDVIVKEARLTGTTRNPQ